MQQLVSIPIGPGEIAGLHALLAKMLADLPDDQIISAQHKHICGARYEIVETPDGPRLVLYPREPPEGD